MRNKNFTLSEFKSDGRYEMATTMLVSASCPPISPVRRIYYYRKNIIKNLLVCNLRQCTSVMSNDLIFKYDFVQL